MIISKLKKSPMKICNTLHEIQKNFQETRSRKKLSQSKHSIKNLQLMSHLMAKQ